MPEAELLLLSGDCVCTNAQSCGCYCTQCDCGNAKVTSLRSLCIVGTALGVVGTGRTTGAAVIAAVGRTTIAAVGRTAVATCCGSCCRSTVSVCCYCGSTVCAVIAVCSGSGSVIAAVVRRSSCALAVTAVGDTADGEVYRRQPNRRPEKHAHRYQCHLPAAVSIHS